VIQPFDRSQVGGFRPWRVPVVGATTEWAEAASCRLRSKEEEAAMALMRRERFDFPEFFRFEFPDLLRRTVDLDWDTNWLRVEEFVDDGTMVVRAELPDIDPDKDVEVTVTDGMLHIRAHREEKTEHKDKGGYRSEFRYGSLVRNLPLPAGVTDTDVTATYTDGVLEIRAPLPVEEAKPDVTKVPVTRT
jgi:HSP20 family protein